MEVVLENIGKRFEKEWIFRSVNLSIQSGERIAIIGPNGSGKSTLLQILSAYMHPSEGSIRHTSNGQSIAIEDVFKNCSFVAPYLDIYQELSLKEFLDFHFSMRSMRSGVSRQSIDDDLSLPVDHILKSFSSGMIQRVKLALAFYTESDILLLDEPTMNLDSKGTAWYQEQLSNLPESTTVVIASNIGAAEVESCTRQGLIREGQLVLSSLEG